MTGVCASCGAEVSVRSTRGSRLADSRCPHCGGELHGKTAGRKGSASSYANCVICGKRRRADGANVIYPAFRYTPRWGAAFGRNDNVGPHEAGAPCCWSHEPVPAELEADLPAKTAILVGHGHVYFVRELYVEEKVALAALGGREPDPEQTIGRAGVSVTALRAALSACERDQLAVVAPPAQAHWPLLLSSDPTLLLTAGLDRLAAAREDEYLACLYPLRPTR